MKVNFKLTVISRMSVRDQTPEVLEETVKEVFGEELEKRSHNEFLEDLKEINSHTGFTIKEEILESWIPELQT